METGAISKRISLIEKLKHEQQTSKDMLDDALINDDEFRKLQMQVDTLKEDLAAKKSEILARESNEPNVVKHKEIGRDLKEEREILAEELVEYYRQTGGSEIESAEGKRMKLKFSARVIPLEN